MDLPPSIRTFGEEHDLALQTFAGPTLSLSLESRESAFEISPVPRTHTYGRRSPQPDRNPQEPDLPYGALLVPG